MLRLLFVALLAATPLSADVSIGKAQLTDLGYMLERNVHISKTGETEDSEHFEFTLPNDSNIEVSFEYSAALDPEHFTVKPYGAILNDGVKVIFITGVGQALCAQRPRHSECLVLTEGFHSLLLSKVPDLDGFPYIHFVTESMGVEDLISVVTGLRRAKDP